MKPLTLTHSDGTIEVLYDPTPKQLQFHQRTEPNVLFWGGRGSGKSVALRWEAHIRALNTPNFTYVILRRTYPELQKSHLMFISQEMKKLGGYFHHQNKTAIYPNGSKGIYSHCSGEEDVLNLLSAQFTWMGVDEISTFPWDMFTKLAASVRVPKNSGLIAMVRACTNPLGTSAEDIQHYFIDKDVDPEVDPDYNPADWFNIKANLVDNPHIDQEQYRKRFSGLAPHVRKAWLDGEFAMENALFDFFPTKHVTTPDGETNIPYHVVTTLDLPKLVKASRIYRAIDAGWFPDPTICLWIAHLGNRYIVIREKLWYKTVASDIARDIKLVDEELGIQKVSMTYCDPSMDVNTTADIRTIRDIYEQHGVPMECSINNREMFASSVHKALNEEAELNVPRLQIYGPRCPYLTKSIPQQRYNLKKPEALADSTTDHGVVALAYFLMTHSADDHVSILAGSKPKPWMNPRKQTKFVLGSENVRDTR